MALLGVIALLIFIYLRPHEFVERLAELPFLYLALGVAVVGFLVDLGRGKARLFAGPHMPYTLAFLGWSLLTLAFRNASVLVASSVSIAVAFTLYAVLAHGVQTVSALKKTMAVMFLSALVVAAIGVHQHYSPYGCMVVDEADRAGKSVPDGRPCEAERDGELLFGPYQCYETGQPGIAYLCEHIGLLGTTSIGGGRVRYLGVLADPNELALATALAIPFAFAYFEERRSLLRLLLLLVAVSVIGLEIVFTQSRGGQLVLGAVLGAYFVKKYGFARGVAVAALLALPLLLFGGRSSEEADQSSVERLEAAGAGIQMAMRSPVWGVGYTQFMEHHPLTAHNAYVLAAGELGFVGIVLFGVLLYLSIKIPVLVLRHDFPETNDDDIGSLRPMAMALLAAFGGLVIGIFFLSWTYHYVLWIHFGLTGALYGVAKAFDPEFEVRVGLKEVVLVAVAALLLLTLLAGYVIHKDAW